MHTLEKKVHAQRNPGHAYEKRALTLRWYAPPEWLIRPMGGRGRFSWHAANALRAKVDASRRVCASL